MAWTTAAEWLETGGPVLYVLLAMSVLALTIILAKLWQLLGSRALAQKPAREALDLWRQGQGRLALQRVEAAPGPLAEVLAVAMRGKLDPEQPEERVREEAARVAVGRLESLRGMLRGLEVIGALSPLLGLLGTVLGMIAAFRNLQAAGNQVDPAILSGGIWEALLTTAAGLVVAIPVVAAFNLFERAIERLRHRMEDAVTRVFTQAPRHAEDKARRVA